MAVDIDSLPAVVHGHQPGSLYNGHYGDRIYHPLIASAGELGDLLGGKLRHGNVHTADCLSKAKMSPSWRCPA